VSLLILQITIKQWDKAQRTPAHVLQRAAIPKQQPIQFPPAVYCLDKRCVIDQHGDDVLGGRVKYPEIAAGIITFDRFQINVAEQSFAYCGGKADGNPRILGSINKQWLQLPVQCLPCRVVLLAV
jgi:hypothetical protein